MDGPSDTSTDNSDIVADVVKGIGGLVTSLAEATNPWVKSGAAATDIVAGADGVNGTKDESTGDQLFAVASFLNSGIGGVVAIGETALGVEAGAALAPGFGTAGILIAGAAGWYKVGNFAAEQAMNAYFSDRTPDPNSVGGDGTTEILVSSKAANRRPTTGVSDPPDASSGVIGSSAAGGAGQVVQEIKGVKSTRTPGSVNPNVVNPAPDSAPPAHREAPPATGNINTWTGQPGGSRGGA